MRNLDCETRILRCLGWTAIVLAGIGIIGMVSAFALPGPVALFTYPGVIIVLSAAAIKLTHPIRSVRSDPHSWLHVDFSAKRLGILFQCWFGMVGIAVVVFVWMGPDDASLPLKISRACGFAGAAFSLGVAGILVSGQILGHRLFAGSPARCRSFGYRMLETTTTCSECGADRANTG